MSATIRNPNAGRLAAVILLVLPLAVYTLLYLVPIGSMISLSLDNGELGRSLRHFSASDAADPDARAAALLADMKAMNGRQQAESARALNQEMPGFRSLFINTARKADEIAPAMSGLTGFDKRWADPRYWEILDHNAGTLTSRHFRRATGLDFNEEGRLGPYGDDIYLQVMIRTLVIAVQVTMVTLVIGYPLAYAVANGSRGFSNFVLISILLSFWTSILVRTTAWVILLQTSGLVNTALLALGVIDEPLQLIFNRFGTIVSMTHVLLPFAIIPMMNVMLTIPKSQADASRVLGAGPFETFVRVYFPQTLRGVMVGGSTVFILALGFYITPALTGGPSDQMLSYYIADFVKKTLNWGMAAALSVMLLAAVLVLVGMAGALNWVTSRRREVA